MAVSTESKTESGALAADLIAKARAALDAGKGGEAFDALDRAVSNTADPVLLEEIRQLAQEGYEQASLVSRYTMWRGLVKAAKQALALEGRIT